MLTYRMLLLFFRDRLNVFFSLFATLIILMLYVMFLGDIMEQNLQQALGFWDDQIRVAMASLTMAGMVAVTSVTSCIGALGISVADKENSERDFLTSPIPRWKITLGYVTGAGMVGLIMTSLALVFVLVYVTIIGGSLPSGANIGKLVLTVVLSALCGNAMMFFATLFINTRNAFSGFSSVVSSLIGFIMGIFIPVGVLPGTVQWVVRIFPMSHAAAMFRQVLADEKLTDMFTSAPDGYLQNFRVLYGLVYEYGGFTSSFWFSAAVLAGFTMLFLTLSVLVMRNKRN